MSPMAWLLWFTGTAVVAWTFRKRPATVAGYVYPYYVIPALFWFVGFLPALTMWWSGPADMTVYSRAVEAHEASALGYLTLCLVMFKVGFRISFQSKALAGLLDRMAAQFDDARMRRTALTVAIINFGLVSAALGSDLYDVNWGLWSIQSPVVEYAYNFFIFPFNVLAAGLFGLGWPSKEERSAQTWVNAGLVLMLTSMPMMAKFSRSAGFMPVIMLAGYMIRWRRIPVMGTALVLLAAFYMGHVGLTGRGVYGHYAGMIPYVQHFFNVENLTWDSFTTSSTSAQDALTPLCVSMQVRELGTYVGQMSVWNWLYFQIPLPHIGGFGGEYTLDLTYYLGGRGTWGYTATMFGDTVIHFGWWGSVLFGVMGMMYRFLENTVKLHEERSGLGAFALCLFPAAYFAFIAGSFNTFRTWNSLFVFGTGLVLAILWVLQILVPKGDTEYMPPLMPEARQA